MHPLFNYRWKKESILSKFAYFYGFLFPRKPSKNRKLDFAELKRNEFVYASATVVIIALQESNSGVKITPHGNSGNVEASSSFPIGIFPSGSFYFCS